MAIKHPFINPKADKSDTSRTRPSDWNAAHTIEAGTILDIHVGAGAAIGWSKIDKTGASLADLPTRNYSDLGSIPSTFTSSAHQLDSAYHTVSALTPGHFLKATGVDTFGFAVHGLSYGDVGALAAGGTAVDTDKLDGQHGSYYAISGAAPTAHALIDATGHTVSGLTPGHFLKATGATTYDFGVHGLGYGDVGVDRMHGYSDHSAVTAVIKMKGAEKPMTSLRESLQNFNPSSNQLDIRGLFSEHGNPLPLNVKDVIAKEGLGGWWFST